MSTPRVTEVHRTNFTVNTGEREVTATVRGAFHAEGDFPKVGDYVEISMIDGNQAVIESIDERRSVIKRKAADSEEEQIIAANVDVIFIVMGLDGDFNPSRLERYLLLAAQSNIEPVVILNKSDLDYDSAFVNGVVEGLSSKVKVLFVSAINGDGLDEMMSLITQDKTAVLIGSSGAGKSTITNFLLGESKQEVKTIREDDSRGRHTTTSRQLFVLPTGGYLIDTPGMRELGVIESETKDESEVFNTIEQLAEGCRFRNCDHEKSAGCAVLLALESGELTEREFNNYQKLLREKSFHEHKHSSANFRHKEQIMKRQSQYEEAQKRKRLSRGV